MNTHEMASNPKDRILPILESLRSAVNALNAPVITLLAEKGKDPYKILIATILSLRTQDKTTHGALTRLFEAAPTMDALLFMDDRDIESLIYPVGFYRQKSKLLKQIASILKERYHGNVPSTEEELLSLPGVGKKTAALVLGKGFGIPAVCVDTHVHRISNRLGLVKTKTPEQTQAALMALIPKPSWIEWNDLLVALGQTICHPTSPKCSVCPIAGLCPRRGVKRSR
jgi:endonuclease-3